MKVSPYGVGDELHAPQKTDEFEPFVLWEGPYEGYEMIRVVYVKKIGPDRFQVETKQKDLMGAPTWHGNHSLSVQMNGSSLATVVLEKLAETCHETNKS